MILKYPFPYKSWFTIANDPDNTLIEDWHELNQFLWNTLDLPLSNSLFIKSFNHNLPDQVNLIDHPEILSQKHDIIHTWGDYMHSRNLGFDRKDAIEACEILKKSAIEPKVWIDHSQFIGNLLHSSNKGSIPQTRDASGIVYKNYVYTLDLIKKIGIRYIWDGKITDVVGQDRIISPSKYFINKSTFSIKAVVKIILYHMLRSKRIRNRLHLNIPCNKQYFPLTFPDGNTLYCFRRYGTWKDADIYGLGKILAPNIIDSLLESESTMVAYTHLGKRPVSKTDESFHIPDETKRSLDYIKKKYERKELMISPISEMIDYLVIRDNIKLLTQKNIIKLIPDGIRYQNIAQSDLTGKKFSFKNNNQFNLEKIKIQSKNTTLKFDTVVEKDKNVFSIIFK